VLSIILRHRRGGDRHRNDTDYGLAGGVCAEDAEHANAVGAQALYRPGRVSTGEASNPLAPFGGYKQSGNGREYGEIGFEEFLEVKSLQL